MAYEQPSLADMASSLPDEGDATQINVEAVMYSLYFRNEDNGYTVAQFHLRNDATNRRRFTGVGFMPFVTEGDQVDLKGKWINHKTYGRQLQITSCALNLQHDRLSLLAYLSSGAVTGIGKKLAERIVDRFDTKALDIMRDDPDRLSEISGISKKKALDIKRQVGDKTAQQELSLLLARFSIGPARIMSIHKQYGENAVNLIRQNPYRLAQDIKGIGFFTADKMALAFGCDQHSPARFGSAMQHALSENEQDGHTFIFLVYLYKKVLTLLQETSDDAKLKTVFLIAYRQLLEGGQIKAYTLSDQGFLPCSADEWRRDVRVSLTYALGAELYCTKKLLLLAHQNKKTDSADQAGLMTHCAKSGIVLAFKQKAAIMLACQHQVSIITGGPGTGKTMLIKVLVTYFESKGQKTYLCAPTGRAAKRMSASAGVFASTIHRLLEAAPDETGGAIIFNRNENNPIEADVLIVDETSMLDIFLFEKLLRAVRNETQMIFVGDRDQLPPVGAGFVLSDMIRSKCVPVAQLTEIFRQEKQSRIVINAHRVLKGEAPIFDQSLESDCLLVQKDGADEIAAAVMKLFVNVLPEVYHLDVLRDVAILTPSRRGPAGVIELNDALQDAMGRSDSKKIVSRGFSFYEHDRVMQTRNNYALMYQAKDQTTGAGVFNGEVGIVEKIDVEQRCCQVQFDDGRRVVYDAEALEDLEPAYAMTVHKSQGSEYPAVILALAPGPGILYSRNLLYTAMTRAKQRLFIVGAKATLTRMIENARPSERRTSLGKLLQISKKI